MAEASGVHDAGITGSQGLLDHAFDRMPVAMVLVDGRGCVVLLNAQAEKMFGYARAELAGQPIEMLVPQRFRARHPGFRSGFFHEPNARPMGAGRSLFGLRKDGSEFPVEIGLNPIETEQGPMVLSAIVDITARQRLERRFQQVVESSPSAMVMIDGTGNIAMVNAQAEKVFAYSRDEMVGHPVEMLVPKRFRDGHPHFRHGFFSQPKARPMGAGRDLFGLRKDGSEFPIEIGLNPIETDEGPMVLSAIVDITERKQREERLNAALKEKELLLGEIHHRVKNNLQVIHSLLDLQALGIADPRVQEMVRDSQARVRSMALIHQTLYQSKDFARVNFQIFLNSLLPALIDSHGVDAMRITLDVDAHGVQLPINAAIPCGLVVNELVTNALKHAFPGETGGGIRVELSENPGEPGGIVLVVENDGVPMDEGLDLERSGTLGLRLVKLLSEQLQGRMEIRRSKPTRFTLFFPAGEPS